MISFAKLSAQSAHACILGLALFLVSAILTLPGCGGGTTGTGGTGSSQFSGRILTFNGEPISGASVVLEETGDTAISDSAGNFDIESILPGDSATFLVETSTAQASTVLTNIPPGPHDVTVELKLDEKKNTVTIQTQSIKPPTKPRKTPTPRPRPSDAPTAEPTVVVKPSPSAAPTEIAIPTQIPGPVETLSPLPGATVVPLPAETVAPEAPTLVVFRGVALGDPVLLEAVRLGLVGSTKRVRIQPDGTFFFRATVLTSRPLLEALMGVSATQIPLDEVTSNAHKVILRLHISLRSSGGVALSIDSVRIIE